MPDGMENRGPAAPPRTGTDYRPAPGAMGRPNTRPPYACEGCTDHGWVLVGDTPAGWPVWGVCPECRNPNDEPKPI